MCFLVARRINADFIDYGGVEQGPNAEIRSGESKFPDYWISSILNILYQFSPAILIDKKEKPKNIDNDFFHLVGVEQVPEARISCCDLFPAIEEAWTMTSRFRHFSVKFGCFLCFRGVSRWLEEA